MDFPAIVHCRIGWGTEPGIWQNNFILTVDFSGDNRIQRLYFSH